MDMPDTHKAKVTTSAKREEMDPAVLTILKCLTGLILRREDQLQQLARQDPYIIFTKSRSAWPARATGASIGAEQRPDQSASQHLGAVDGPRPLGSSSESQQGGADSPAWKQWHPGFSWRTRTLAGVKTGRP